jgi:hypothetical protein
MPASVDTDGRVHRAMRTADPPGGDPSCLLCLSPDRFGAVFAPYQSARGKKLPDIEEIVSRIDFINRQCPECGPLEWPK